MRMIGVDVGGTFTDAVFYDDATRELRWGKAASSPGNPGEAVLAALGADGRNLRDVDRFVHGITIGTNAILERKGATVWMVTTRGFRDTIEIARTNRTTLYDIKTLKPPPLVDRRHVVEINERVLASGEVLRPLEMHELEHAAETLRGQPPGALVVGFLHSYANPRHEAAAAAFLSERLPDWFVCHSAEVLPEMREYERFNTAVINGYIGPTTAAYLGQLEQALRAKGYGGEVFLMISSGGIVTARRAARFPVQTVLSGPAGGVAAALELGALLEIKNLITYDMGGTSTDVCLIDDLNVPTTSDQFIEGYPIRTPQIDIRTIGAGGGSVAWIDAGRILKVGPRSAGAVPGPACYGKGGREATVTDANLVLGRLSSQLKLAGSLPMDERLAAQAVDRVAEAFPELDRAATAEGIVRIAVARMVSAIKEISIGRGYDPRDFVLLAYGGAGPMHAAFIAEELEITRVLVPPRPGNFSAFGALISDIRHDHVRSRRIPLVADALAELPGHFEKLEADAVEAMVGEGMPRDRIDLVRGCGMRYVGQSWDLPVRLPADVDLRDAEALARLFHEAHEKRFGYRLPNPIEIVTLQLAAIGRVDKPQLREWGVGSEAADALMGERPVRFAGAAVKTPVYSRDALPAGARLKGPAVVEEMGSVTVAPPGWTLTVGRFGELYLQRDAA